MSFARANHDDRCLTYREGPAGQRVATKADVALVRSNPKAPHVSSPYRTMNVPEREGALVRTTPGGGPIGWDYLGPTPGDIVMLLRAFVIAHLARRLDIVALAGAAGVSERVLRRAIRVETGLQVSVFVLVVKLDQARGWLSTNRECRSIAEISLALGARSPASMSRAYARLFGESMSETRRRAANDAACNHRR